MRCSHHNGTLTEHGTTAYRVQIVDGVVQDIGDGEEWGTVYTFTCTDCGQTFRAKANNAPAWMQRLIAALDEARDPV